VSDLPLVLCADDEEDILALIALRLRRLGCAVITAADGSSALAIAEERVPDVVVLDVMMPRMTGLEVVEALRANPRLAGVKVVLLSARVQEADRQRGLDAGADAYLTKPFRFEDLDAVVEKLLGR
jgi:CheY-like chemotaxis protein